MLDVQTLVTLLNFNESELLHDVMASVMATPRVAAFVQSHQNLALPITQQLDDWSRHLRRQWQQSPVPTELEQEFELYQQARHWSVQEFSERMEGLVTRLRELSPFYPQAKDLLPLLSQSHPGNRQDQFLRRWHNSLIMTVMGLQMAIVDREREQLLAELEQRMQVIDEVEGSLDTAQPGGLWDLSRARLSRGEGRLLRHYARLLANNPELKAIADQLGRTAREQTRQQEEVAVTEALTTQFTPQETMPDDMVGVHPNDKITRMLPSEAVLLSQPELETVFYKHLVERRLLNYQFMGQAPKPLVTQVAQRHHGEEIEPKGPFLICIDTSGSMSGYPEQCAKALCFGLMQTALSEQRDCIIMLFSTDVVSYQLTGTDGLQEAAHFLGHHFHGGTDFDPCLRQALAQMQSEQYRNADAIVLSDFIAQRPAEALLEQVNALKCEGNRFNAVSFSRHGKPGVLQMFDNTWLFDSGLGTRLLRKLR